MLCCCCFDVYRFGTAVEWNEDDEGDGLIFDVSKIYGALLVRLCGTDGKLMDPFLLMDLVRIRQ